MKSTGQSLRRPLVAAAATRRSAPARDGAEPYLSIGETHALLAGSLAGRTARLAQADMISTEEAALLNGTSRVTVNAWIDKGRAIGLTQNKRGYRMPKWQFEPRLWDALPQLSAALGTKEGWALLAFLETPLGALQGNTPRAKIEQGKVERVLQLAMAEGQ
jgi:hypothetical protein